MRQRKIIKVLLILTVIMILLVVGSVKIAKSVYPLKYSNSIKSYAKKYNLDPILVASVINTESKYNPKAKSSKNALGLMQITPSTAEWAAKEMKTASFNTDMLYDPEFNINMGCWYLGNLKTEFKDDIDLVLAAYNGGRGNVKKWLSDANCSKDGVKLNYIPFKETDEYIKRVKVNYNIYKFLYTKEFK